MDHQQSKNRFLRKSRVLAVMRPPAFGLICKRSVGLGLKPRVGGTPGHVDSEERPIEAFGLRLSRDLPPTADIKGRPTGSRISCARSQHHARVLEPVVRRPSCRPWSKSFSLLSVVPGGSRLLIFNIEINNRGEPPVERTLTRTSPSDAHSWFTCLLSLPLLVLIINV